MTLSACPDVRSGACFLTAAVTPPIDALLSSIIAAAPLKIIINPCSGLVPPAVHYTARSTLSRVNNGPFDISPNLINDYKLTRQITSFTSIQENN